MKEGVDEERPEAIPRRAWIILGILGLVGLVTTYGETMIIPAIPDLIHEFDKRRLATAQGIIAAVFSGGAVIGLAVGGTIIEAFDWRATFLSVVPLSIMIIIIIRKLIHDEKSIPVEASTLP